MDIERQISHNQGIIFALLKKYNIYYDIEEYVQLLNIKMWQLIHQFDMSIHNSMSRYLFQRLHYYLIDLFRNNRRQTEFCSLDAVLTQLPEKVSNHMNLLILKDYYHLLNEQERLWLNLKLFGFKQYEIQKLMNKSATTIRKYQSHARAKLEPLRKFLKGDGAR